MNIKVSDKGTFDTVQGILSSFQVIFESFPDKLLINAETTDEGSLRCTLMYSLDKLEFDSKESQVLVNGNTIWSLKRLNSILSEIKEMGTSGDSDYLYAFMHVNVHEISFDDVTYEKISELLTDEKVPEWKYDIGNIIKTLKNV